MNDIIFTLVFDGHDGPKPTPAKDALPTWYKETKPYLDKPIPQGSPEYPVGTIKKCMPVYDSMTAGYMIYTPTDVIVNTVDGEPYFQWYGEHTVIAFHEYAQADKHPKISAASPPRWVNFWSIKTPKGYSCLFTAPLNGDDSPFSILPGIVDTDEFNSPVNLPFTFKDPNFNGLIPQGTPLCQVIPFKREDWKMKMGSEEDAAKAKNQGWRVNRLDMLRYRNAWWSKKSYK